jgi:hypothetical protein
MSEKVLERLNYYNGQRLEASDLKTEQEYHIRVRRWLNKSLYSPGIARGLEVRPGAGPQVIVSPGLALDADGHEIILWNEEPVDVVGDARHHQGTGSEAEVDGLYLTIRYDEELTAVEQNGCTPRTHGKAAKRNRTATGGPSRVVATPLFCWRAFLPSESSGEIVLAQVELDDTCSQVHQINVGVRRYVGAGSAAKVRQYALDGGLDLDDRNPQRIYFHIRGRQPTSVTLYLRSEKLSTMHYTEVGQHIHTLEVKLQGGDGKHQHDLGTHETRGETVAHTHLVAPEVIKLEQPNSSDVANLALNVLFPGLGAFANVSRSEITNRLAVTPQYSYSFSFVGINVAKTGDFPKIIPNDGNFMGGPIRTGNDGDHTHAYGSTPAVVELTLANDPNSAHTHAFSSSKAFPGGIKDPAPPAYSARTDDPLTYLEGLEVWIGKDNQIPIPRTNEVLQQLADAAPTDWLGKTRLGEAGRANDILKDKGTGPIRLDFLPGIYFTEGEHFIELRVAAKLDNNGQPKIANGGRVLYNLYVE